MKTTSSRLGSRPWFARIGWLLALVMSLTLGRAGLANAAEGPALTVDGAMLERALTCHGDLANATHNPVILVHGAATNATESWRSGYVHALTSAGVSTCTVDLPDRAMGDIQVSAEYAVHAVRQVSIDSGRQVALVGHSEGALVALWAVRFWSDVRERVTDVIGIAAPFSGTALANAVCQPPLGCQPAIWQMAVGSRFLAAATAAPLPPGPAYTSIGTMFDELSVPGPSSIHLTGARNILVQDVCPGRPIDHLALLYDSVTFALVRDALDHDGPADPSHLSPLDCANLMIPSDFNTFATDSAVGILSIIPPYLLAPRVAGEPPLRPYAGTQTLKASGTTGTSPTESESGRSLAVPLRHPEGQPYVLGQELPRTGASLRSLAILGVGLAVIGTVLSSLAGGSAHEGITSGRHRPSIQKRPTRPAARHGAR